MTDLSPTIIAGAGSMPETKQVATDVTNKMAALIASLKSQQAVIESQAATIASQAATISDLDARVTALEP